jgi:hypothetical protein
MNKTQSKHGEHNRKCNALGTGTSSYASCTRHKSQQPTQLRTSGGAQLRAGMGGTSLLGGADTCRASPMSANFSTKSCKAGCKHQ